MPKALKIILFILCLVIFVLLIVVQIKSCTKASALGLPNVSNNGYNYDPLQDDEYLDTMAFSFKWARYLRTVGTTTYNQYVFLHQSEPFTYRLGARGGEGRTLIIELPNENYVNILLQKGQAGSTTTSLSFDWLQYAGSPQETQRTTNIGYFVTFQIDKLHDIAEELSTVDILESNFKFYSVNYHSIAKNEFTGYDGGYSIVFDFVNMATSIRYDLKVNVLFRENVPSAVEPMYTDVFYNDAQSDLYGYYTGNKVVYRAPNTTPIIYVDNYKLGQAYGWGDNKGYQAGYQAGYKAGVDSLENGATVASSFFGALSSILDINIFPNFSIGTLLTFIVGLAMLTFIIKFIKG